MKFNILTLVFFLTLFLNTFGNDTLSNILTVGNNKFSLDYAELANESYGIHSKFEVDLVNQHNNLTTAKTYVYFSLTGSNTGHLSDGIYHFSSATLSERLPHQFSGALKINNHNVEITGGTIVIETRKSDFGIQFILKLKNGDIAKGIYGGKVVKSDRSKAYH